MMGGGPRHMMMAEETKKAKNTGQTLNRLLRYFGAYGWILGIVLTLLLFNTFTQVLRPAILGQAIDCFIAPSAATCPLVQNPPLGMDVDIATTAGRLAGLATLMIVYGLLTLLGAVSGGLQFYLMSLAGQRVLLRLRNQIFDQIHRLTLSYYDRNEAGDIMSRLTNDADTIAQAVNFSLVQVGGNMLLLIGIVIAMLSLQPALGLIVLLILPFMFGVTRWLSRLARRAFRRSRQEMGSVNADLEQGIVGVREAQAFSREDENLERFRESNAANRDANVRAVAITSALRPSLDLLGNIMLAIVAGVGGAFALSGEPLLGGVVTVGVIVAFVRYVDRFNRPVQVISQQWAQIQSALAGAERMFEMLDEVPDIQDKPDAVELPAISGRVVFDDISFAYKADEPVLKHVSLTVEPGQTIAIVGPTGAGKSTIMNLIGRFYEVDDGTVSIDGYDVRDVTRQSLRRQLGIVLQDTVLFTGTIANNIRYGRPEASMEEVIAAAKLAHAHDFIDRMPDGYETVVGERGAGLSQGQRQLIAIARAALADPRILLLDEATSSVDTRTERLIQAALAKLLEGRTSFVVAHRLSTIRNADQVLVIQDGEIVERGTHDELLAAGGAYYDLYMSQFRRQVDLDKAQSVPANGRQAPAVAPATGN